MRAKHADGNASKIRLVNNWHTRLLAVDERFAPISICWRTSDRAKGRTAVSLSAAQPSAKIAIHCKGDAEVKKAKGRHGEITRFSHHLRAGVEMYFAAHQRSPRIAMAQQAARRHAARNRQSAGSIAPIPAVVKIIAALCREKTQTASGGRGRIERILDYAEVPAGTKARTLPAGTVQRPQVLPWRETGAFRQRRVSHRRQRKIHTEAEENTFQ
jgi:hypothetical protein